MINFNVDEIISPPKKPGISWPPPAFGESYSVEELSDLLKKGKVEEAKVFFLNAASIDFCPTRPAYKLWYPSALKLVQKLDYAACLWLFRRIVNIRRNFLLSLQGDSENDPREYELALEACRWSYPQYRSLLKQSGQNDLATKVKKELNLLLRNELTKMTYPSVSIAINEKRFWCLIEAARDSDGMVDFLDLEARLAAHKPKQIIEFAKILDVKIAALYTRKVLKYVQSRRSVLSDDGFEYFCAGVVSLGKPKYESVLEDPTSLTESEIEHTSAEELLLTPEDAYQAAEGEDWHKKFIPTRRPGLRGAA